MDVTGILEQGIAAKRSGDYDQAVTLYKKAQSLCPDDHRAYGNLAKLFTGTGRYEEALRYWLILCEQNRIAPAFDPMAEMEIQSNIGRFLSEPLILPGNLITTDLVAATIERKPHLLDLIYRADNLTFYIGHCVVRAVPSLFEAYDIPELGMDNLESALLGRPVGEDLRQSDSDHVFLIAALAFCDMNLRCNMDTLSSAAALYLGKAFTPNTDIREFRAQTPVQLYAEEGAPPPEASADIKTLWEAATSGDVEAIYTLGKRYQDGEGVSPDAQAAVSWFSKGAELGHADSMFMMGIMYQIGQGVEKDNKRASHWFQQSGEAGCTLAWMKLGRIYEEGWGVPKDIAQAKRCYQRAADAGDQMGVLKLMTMR